MNQQQNRGANMGGMGQVGGPGLTLSAGDSGIGSIASNSGPVTSEANRPGSNASSLGPNDIGTGHSGPGGPGGIRPGDSGTGTAGIVAGAGLGGSGDALSGSGSIGSGNSQPMQQPQQPQQQPPPPSMTNIGGGGMFHPSTGGKDAVKIRGRGGNEPVQEESSRTQITLLY